MYILGENFGQVLMYNYRHYFRQKPWTSFNVYLGKNHGQVLMASSEQQQLP